MKAGVLLLARELGWGGSERQLAAVAKSLDRSRFVPHVGCLRAPGARGEELRAAGVPVVCFPVRSLYRPSTLGPALQLGWYLREHRIQLVHAFDVPMNLFGVPLARAFGARVVISSQRARRDLTPGLRRHLLRVTDQIVDAIVVNCRHLQDHLIAEERVPAGRVHLCYNGIDPEEFRPLPRDSPNPGALTVGVVCSLRPEKGLSTLLDAFARVRTRHAGLRLLVVGSGPCLADLEALSRRLGISDACHFEPATARVAPWLNGIDIFVLPSLTEGLSNSLMEAMACGCAVVASRVGGNMELVEDGFTGLLFDSGNAGQLAERLTTLVADQTFCQKLAAAGLRLIRDNFSLRASAEGMAAIYERNLGVA